MLVAVGTLPEDTEYEIPSSDPRIVEFLDAWKDARHGELIPHKSKFDPLRIPALLPYIWMAHYDDDVGDFVCRLAGEKINATWGRQIRGLRLRDMEGVRNHAHILNRWRSILDDATIEYSATPEEGPGFKKHATERLILPMRDDAGTPRFLIGMTLYLITAQERKKRPPIPTETICVPCAAV